MKQQERLGDTHGLLSSEPIKHEHKHSIKWSTIAAVAVVFIIAAVIVTHI